MKFRDEHTRELPLLGGVVQGQRLVLPPQAILGIKSYRHACRLAWRLRRTRLTQAQLASLCTGLYQSHISDYFSALSHTKSGRPKRELPARNVAEVEQYFCNTVISQYLAQQSKLTVLEELQMARLAA